VPVDDLSSAADRRDGRSGEAPFVVAPPVLEEFHALVRDAAPYSTAVSRPGPRSVAHAGDVSRRDLSQVQDRQRSAPLRAANPCAGRCPTRPIPGRIGVHLCTRRHRHGEFGISSRFDPLGRRRIEVVGEAISLTRTFRPVAIFRTVLHVGFARAPSMRTSAVTVMCEACARLPGSVDAPASTGGSPARARREHRTVWPLGHVREDRTSGPARKDHVAYLLIPE
jgi:hypothetical protein